MSRKKTIVAIAVPALIVIGLVALTLPVIGPRLPVVQGLGIGTMDTVPVSVDEFLARTDSDRYGVRVEHEDVEEGYVLAASIWPWQLPPGWRFPAERGIADTPGAHWAGMGVRSAFSKWAEASLQTVQNGDLTPAAADDLLDDVEDATRTLLEVRVLSDEAFVRTSIDPLRP